MGWGYQGGGAGGEPEGEEAAPRWDCIAVETRARAGWELEQGTVGGGAWAGRRDNKRPGKW